MTGFFQSKFGSGKQSGNWGGHQLVWFGTDRLLDWDPSVGQFKIWTFDLAGPAGARLTKTSRGGSLTRNLGDRAIWLGRNDLLFVKSNGMAREILRYLPVGRQRFAVVRRFAALGGRQVQIGRDPVYLGRGRILARNPSGAGVRILKVTGTSITEHLPAQVGGAPTAAVPPGNLTLTWMGADRVLGWRDSGQTLALYRHGHLGVPLTGQIVPSTWTLPTGPVARGRRGGRLRGLTPKPSPSAPPLVTYVGQDTALLLWPATGAYAFWKLGFNGSIHPTIEDYLELHPQVADAMTWSLHQDSVPYQDWDLHPWTSWFHATLSRFYDEASWGGPISLAFAQENDPDIGPGQKRVGPGPAPSAPPNDQFMFTLRDMSEIWLAHLAHYLWIEISSQVPWHLHDLGSDLLAVNLPGQQMVKLVPGVPYSVEPLYVPNKLEAGGGLATDPSPVFAFALEKNLLQATRSATVEAICNWVHNSLVHYSVQMPRDYAASWDWNFGTPPLITMIERRLDYLKPFDSVPRYQAWRGCRGACTVLAFLARVLNIPARGTIGYIGGPHGAIDFPEERWFCPHADDFYARPELSDPAVRPQQVFGAKDNYDSDRAFWIDQPGDHAARETDYNRWLYVRARPLPTFWLIEAYWQDIIAGSNLDPNTGILATALESHGLDPQEVADGTSDLGPRIQAIIDAFMQTPEIAGKTLQEGLDAYRAPIDAWKAAKGTT